MIQSGTKAVITKEVVFNYEDSDRKMDINSDNFIDFGHFIEYYHDNDSVGNMDIDEENDLQKEDDVSMDIFPIPTPQPLPSTTLIENSTNDTSEAILADEVQGINVQPLITTILPEPGTTLGESGSNENEATAQTLKSKSRRKYTRKSKKKATPNVSEEAVEAPTDTAATVTSIEDSHTNTEAIGQLSETPVDLASITEEPNVPQEASPEEPNLQQEVSLSSQITAPDNSETANSQEPSEDLSSTIKELGDKDEAELPTEIISNIINKN